MGSGWRRLRTTTVSFSHLRNGHSVHILANFLFIFQSPDLSQECLLWRFPQPDPGRVLGWHRVSCASWMRHRWVPWVALGVMAPVSSQVSLLPSARLTFAGYVSHLDFSDSSLTMSSTFVVSVYSELKEWGRGQVRLQVWEMHSQGPMSASCCAIRDTQSGPVTWVSPASRASGATVPSVLPWETQPGPPCPISDGDAASGHFILPHRHMGKPCSSVPVL